MSDNNEPIFSVLSGKAALTLTDTVSGANDCNERVDIGAYPEGTDNVVLVVTGSVEGNSTSTLNYTVTSIDGNVFSQAGTGAPGGMNVVVSYYGASSPKYLLIRGQYYRATSNVTVSVTARNSSNTELASGSITSGLGTVDCGD